MSDRARTGIPGLDDVLGGGFPRSRLYVVQGSPGAGKTTIGLQFLLAGRDAGERGLYRDALRDRGGAPLVLNGPRLVARRDRLARGPSARGRLRGSREHALPPRRSRAQRNDGNDHPGNRAAQSRAPRHRLALRDPAPVAERAAVSPADPLAEAVSFGTAMHVDLPGRGRATRRATCTCRRSRTAWCASSSSRRQFGAERRRLRILKLRGVKFRGGYHDFKIETGGIEVFPRLIAAEHLQQVAGRDDGERRSGPRLAPRGRDRPRARRRSSWGRPGRASRSSRRSTRAPRRRAASRS